MTGQGSAFGQTGLRIEVTPDPSSDEILAILEVVRRLHSSDESEIPDVAMGSRWVETARREGVRSAYWPPQTALWMNEPAF